MPKKIAMIGAGSVVFTKTLLSDTMATPCLRDSEWALMSRTAPKLRHMEAFAKRMLKENGLPGKDGLYLFKNPGIAQPMGDQGTVSQPLVDML
jgi:alpha-galactosidase/6-phospho-beta-glucosidase family protein